MLVGYMRTWDSRFRPSGHKNISRHIMFRIANILIEVQYVAMPKFGAQSSNKCACYNDAD